MSNYAELAERLENIALGMTYNGSQTESANKHTIREAAAALREAEALRALLAGLREWLSDDKLNTWRYMEDGDFFTDKREWLARIDAALREKE